MTRIIWNRSDNPTTYVSDALGIERWQLRVALHKLKGGSYLGATDPVIVYDDGRLTDIDGGDIGNILDHVQGR